MTSLTTTDMTTAYASAASSSFTTYLTDPSVTTASSQYLERILYNRSVILYNCPRWTTTSTTTTTTTKPIVFLFINYYGYPRASFKKNVLYSYDLSICKDLFGSKQPAKNKVVRQVQNRRDLVCQDMKITRSVVRYNYVTLAKFKYILLSCNSLVHPGVN